MCAGDIHVSFQDDVAFNLVANAIACNAVSLKGGAKSTIVAIRNNGFSASGRGDKMGMVDSLHTYTHTLKCIWHALLNTEDRVRRYVCEYRQHTHLHFI